jgi:hypothetical protein
MNTLQEILDQQERTVEALYRSNKALAEIARNQARELAARTADDDEWTRMPGRGQRCKVSNWSRSKLNHLIEANKVRRKESCGSVFYAAADVRKLLSA